MYRTDVVPVRDTMAWVDLRTVEVDARRSGLLKEADEARMAARVAEVRSTARDPRPPRSARTLRTIGA